jgi:acyl-CoA oxidase
MPLVKSLKMIGCYAQTELGHGSNVAGLETTATFDEEKDEFVINSPTISSAKYWPGELGKFANHAVVYARLILKGKFNGIHAFMVPIRDSQTHEQLPGIEVGDIGPKFGFNSKDNGYALFKNVRIPRTNLLSRYAEVHRDGTFHILGDLRVLYSIMLQIRVLIANTCGFNLGHALTIGIRYAVVRRQFSNVDGTKQERKLLDY